MIRILILCFFIAAPSFAETAKESVDLSTRLSELIRQSLTEKIADAEIRIPSLAKLMSVPPMSIYAELKTVHLVADKVTGVAQFEVIGSDEEGKELVQTIQTPYEAWKKVPVATHRIYPNSNLKNDDFKVQEVNVATGPARDYRGVMLPGDSDFTSLQTKQTILEGQYVISSAIQKVPDLHKGDSVKLDLVSGELTLTTRAVVQESAMVGSQVRVITDKTKRELMGLVKADRSVEVTL